MGNGHGDVRIVYKILVRKHEGKSFLGRSRWKWEDALQINLK
jgi:hypothetical protein